MSTRRYVLFVFVLLVGVLASPVPAQAAADNVNDQVELADYQDELTGTNLTVTARFLNKATSTNCLRDLSFPLADGSTGNFSYSELVATSAQLGGDAMLCPGETTGEIVFSVTHDGTPFAFFVDVYAETVAKPQVSKCRGKLVTVDLNAGQVPTEGNDVIKGTPDADTIDALGGDDLVCGGGGNDVLIGGEGDDTLDGGSGEDTLIGDQEITSYHFEYGNDLLLGASGNDRLYGDVVDQPYGFHGALTGGNDRLEGGPGNDTLAGDAGSCEEGCYGGDDTLNGGPGNDRLVGDVESGQLITIIFGGDDILLGGPGSDQLFGDSIYVDVVLGGDDVLRGGNGNDTLIGDADYSADADPCPGCFPNLGGDDRLFGDRGRDLLIGDAREVTAGAGIRSGDDQLNGGPGPDTLIGDVAETSDGGFFTDGINALNGGSGEDTCEQGIFNSCELP